MGDGSVLERRITRQLASRQQRSILRRLTPQSNLVDFSSNDYLSLSKSPILRQTLLDALSSTPNILGSSGSRLLDGNSNHHIALEARLSRYFNAEAALLFNSGFDANVGLFSSVPQRGDAIVYDSLIHASVHDGMRASRVSAASRVPFDHNSFESLRETIEKILLAHPSIRSGDSCLFIAVEALYSMDGDLAPLKEIAELVESMLPQNNGHIIVDEAHSTGVYGPGGRGLTAMLGLEHRVLARLHTFGKALASGGAALLTTPLVREYLINYARSLIYTTSLPNANIIAMGCSINMLENGTASQLAERVLSLSSYFLESLRSQLQDIPSPIPVTLPFGNTPPSPIIPLLTSNPRSLAMHLQTHPRGGLLARPITHPTVPKGEERVRVCIHAGNSKDEVDRLVEGVMEWARQEKNRWKEASPRELEPPSLIVSAKL